MFSIKKVLILLFLIFNLTFALKSSNFCVPKQQECKGYYDDNQNYKIKCNTIKCNGLYQTKCGLNMCSQNRNDCKEFKRLNTYIKIKQQLKPTKIKEKNNTMNSFRKHIKDCKYKIYKFELKDFCLNSNDCKTFLGHRYKMVKQVDCKCPNEKNYICGKYCTTDSIACNYFQLLNETKYNFLNIKNCGNQNSVYMKPYFTLW